MTENPEQQRIAKSKTRIWKAWRNMRERCLLKNHPEHRLYESYKHVTHCPEWASSDVFIAWANSNGYGENLQLDRKDNAKGYTPDNCRWVTRSVQSKNRAWTDKRQKQLEAALKLARLSPRSTIRPGTPVVCVETGQEFPSMNAAARAISRNTTRFNRAFTKGQKCGGYHWKVKGDGHVNSACGDSQ